MNITLAIINKDNEVILIPNWPAESCGVKGLAIHKAYNEDKNKNPIPFKRSPGRFWWSITHVQSGIAVVEMILFKTDALKLAAQLTELDWTVPADVIESEPKYGELVRRVTTKYYDECMGK